MGDSHSKNLDKDIFELYTESKIEMLTAYTVDADSNAKYKEKNLLSIVPHELKKKECDVLGQGLHFQHKTGSIFLIATKKTYRRGQGVPVR